MYLISNPSSQETEYLESIYNISIRKKVDKGVKDFNVKFDYYISPNGKNTNHGRFPEFPEFDFYGMWQIDFLIVNSWVVL